MRTTGLEHRAHFISDGDMVSIQYDFADDLNVQSFITFMPLQPRRDMIVDGKSATFFCARIFDDAARATNLVYGDLTGTVTADGGVLLSWDDQVRIAGEECTGSQSKDIRTVLQTIGTQTGKTVWAPILSVREPPVTGEAGWPYCRYLGNKWEINDRNKSVPAVAPFMARVYQRNVVGDPVITRVIPWCGSEDVRQTSTRDGHLT